ncbi:unnamed protein product [Spirodela intermedia]|uniref:DM2 domain-containing protein n=1 Tax=Spirodela intermedia TaxID=51605 RepID=A0A7I8J0X6_SPIIN|nr:unnamed protein product [Spirodela intermedia]CAA6662970.1 unnamed protein product [Spirodela intermedia]
MAAASSLLSGYSASPALAVRVPQSITGSSPFAISLPRGVLAMSDASKSVSTEVPKGKGKPRGISQPRPISQAMQELLGVSEIPRTQALKQIWAYIKQHNLQDTENKKIIICDDKLKRIFGGRDRVGFLEISGLLNPHFMK